MKRTWVAILGVLCGVAVAEAKPRSPEPPAPPPPPPAPEPAPAPRVRGPAPAEFQGVEVLIPPGDARLKNRKPNPLKRPAYLFVETSPETAEIRIEGSLEGRGRVFLRWREDRVVNLQVSAPGMETVSGAVELREEEVLKLLIPLKPATQGGTGALTILTEPTGAEISVDGEFVGRTPLTVRRVPEGRHEVVLVSGSWMYRQDVDVAARQVILVSVPVGASSPPAAPVREASAPVRQPPLPPPAPVVAPRPEPAPAPQPAARPEPAPAPQPAARPEPAPAPQPVAAPRTEPAPAPQPAPVAQAPAEKAPAPAPQGGEAKKPDCRKVCDRFVQAVDSEGAREPIRNICLRRCNASDMDFSVCAWKARTMDDVVRCGKLPEP